MRQTLLACIVCCGLVACTSPTKDSSAPAVPESQSGSLSISSLRSARYTIVTPIVRRVLSSASVGFSVSLRDGIGSFPHPATVSPFDTVRLEPAMFAEGDLNGDGVRDMVGVLSIGDVTSRQTEVVAVTLKGNIPLQIASFPLGQMTVESLQIDGRTLAVSALSVDPGSTHQKLVQMKFSL